MADEVADRVREAIYAGVYAPGAPLREVELATVLRVSRGPVREALLRLEREGLLPSMGSSVDCVDNAMMESFWARVQVGLLDRGRWRTRLELSTALFEYLEIFHNRQRRHSALGMLSPVDYELRTPPVA
ncbi:GntR family transcriptional regulator [Streptomyces sp. NPDC058469]|uniref:GntR family transcriptional regulator n=1 Tax=Streptomyces sp. NPDC058469 TaxID=3346514 RepID=UPI00364FEFF9